MPVFRLVSFIALLIVFQGVNAQDWKELYQSAQTSYQEGDFAASLTTGSKCLEIYIQQNGETSDNYTAILRLLQNAAYANGEYEKGLVYCDKELAIRQNSADLAYAEALSQRGVFLQALQKYIEADASFEQSINLLEHFYQPDHIAIVEANLNIGLNSFSKNDFAKASKIFSKYLRPSLEQSTVVIQAYYYQALLDLDFNPSRALSNFQIVKAYYEAQGLEQSEDYGSLLFSIGKAHVQNKNFNEAENFYTKAQSVFESLKINDDEYLKLLNARAINLHRMGEAAKAEALLSNVSVGGNQNLVKATFFNNKAALLQSNGDLNQALQNYQAALSLLDKTNKQHTEIYIETLLNLSTLYSDMAKTAEALSSINSAESLMQSGGNAKINLTSFYLKKADLLLKSGQTQEARKMFQSVFSGKNKATTAQLTFASNGLASIYSREGNLKKADSILANLTTQYATGDLNKDYNYPAVLNNYASLKQVQGEYTFARTLFRDAANFIKHQSGVKNISYATALENLAYVDLRMGLLQNAKVTIDSALQTYGALLGKNSVQYASVLITLGQFHQNAGDYPAAEPCFKQAYQLMQSDKGNKNISFITALNALGVFYQTMGNYEEAEPLFKQSLTLSETLLGKNSTEYSTALQNIGTLFQLQGKFDLAANMLQQALSLDEKIYGINHPLYVVALKNLAVIYQKSGKLDNAQILLERALQVTKNVFGEEHPSYALTISNLAALYQDRGNFKEAATAWEKSVAVRKKLLGEQHPDYARSLYGLASIHFAQGELVKANTYYEVVVNDYLKQIKENFPSLSEKEKGAFYQKIKPVFDTYQDFCVQFYIKNPGDPQAAKVLHQLYNVQLVTKAILLNSSNKVRHTIMTSGDTALVNAYGKWLTTKEQIVRYYTLTAEERKKSDDINSLQERANDLEKKLSTSSTLFKSQFSDHEIDFADISAALKPDEAAIEIIRIKRKYTADSVYYAGLIVTNNAQTPALVIWPYGKKLEDRFYKFHRNAIKYGLADSLSYHHYFAPLAKALNGVNTLFVSSDGVFNKINLNTLFNGRNARWVLDDYTVKLVSNTKEVVQRSEALSQKNGNVDLYGYIDFNLNMGVVQQTVLARNNLTRNFGFDADIPVLPATETEVDHIHNLLQKSQWKSTTYKKTDANETNLKRTANPAILHIATHGFFLNDIDLSDATSEADEKFFSNPLLRSGLLLAGAGIRKVDSSIDEDGILTAYEAMNLSLDQTDLVVLSACETGLGEVRNGEGVYGLQRSLLIAGANAVLMSLWQVDDVATQDLMVQFYQHWMQGESKHEAFRKAQLAIKEKYTSPYYWGAFIMVGN